MQNLILNFHVCKQWKQAFGEWSGDGSLAQSNHLACNESV
jgi:hypothetical protein